MQKIDPNTLDLKEKVVNISRVAKVVKGGRNFRFSALVVVGDENGYVGIGSGKAAEIPDAIRKGIEDAKKNLIFVHMDNTTIPHEIIGVYGAGKVLLKPGNEGTGVIAGGPVNRAGTAVCVIFTPSPWVNNPTNMVKATMDGLSRLMTVEKAARLRGKSVEEIRG